MSAQVNVARGRLPWRRRIDVIGDAKGNIEIVQQIEDIASVPGLVAEFERVR